MDPAALERVKVSIEIIMAFETCRGGTILEIRDQTKPLPTENPPEKKNAPTVQSTTWGVMLRFPYAKRRTSANVPTRLVTRMADRSLNWSFLEREPAARPNGICSPNTAPI